MTTKRARPPEAMTHIPYPKRRCPDCDYCTDAVTYYALGDRTTNYYVCVDERTIDGHTNPMCGCPVDGGYGCIRWESL